MPKQVSVKEAHSQMAAGATYVDVRTTREFVEGHPEGALNVPLFEPDEDTGMMQANPDFLRVMKANFAPDTQLLIGCEVGGRSMRAAQVLEAFGFTNVANVRGGYSGAQDPATGRIVDPGWVSTGLPVEVKTPYGHTYRDLEIKANEAAGSSPE
jgi:rhodanese-related sulfurtransferase